MIVHENLYRHFLEGKINATYMEWGFIITPCFTKAALTIIAVQNKFINRAFHIHSTNIPHTDIFNITENYLKKILIDIFNEI